MTPPAEPSRPLDAVKRLLAAIPALARAGALEPLMRSVCRSARELTGADAAAFVLRDGDVCVYAEEDAAAPLFKGRRVPVGGCVGGWVLQNAAAAVVGDAASDPRTAQVMYASVKSLIMVPVGAGEPLAALGCHWAAPHEHAPHELELVQALADAAAAVIENMRAQARLEARVAELTRDLEMANADLESLSRSVSHDLRAPVRAVGGFSAIIVEDYGDSLSDEVRAKLAVIQSEAERMGRLITDLLAFARLGRSELEPAELDMHALATSAFAHEVALEPGRRAELVVGELPPAYGDAALVAQVWTQLLANAVKFSAKTAAPRIEIEGARRDGELVYTVRDNGAGFDPRYAGKLFQPFQRLHTESEFKGTGVGLALVHRVVTRHGGRIWAEGKPGAGAAFHFALPVKR